MRALVTGASGLVGAHLCHALLARGDVVVGFDRALDHHSPLVRGGDHARVHFVSGELEDLRAVTRALVHHDCDTVFHLGAQSQVTVAQRDPLGTFESNVRGTWNVLEACRLHRNQISAVVVASSDKAYGEAETLPYTEETPLRAIAPYDVSKACADLLAQSYARSFSLPVVVARCGNIFGGGDLHWYRIIPGTIRAFARGAPIELRSDGSLLRDYIFVDDVVAAYLALAEAARSPGSAGEAFNFARGEPLSVHAIVDAIARVMDVPGDRIVRGDAPGEIRAQHLSSQKAQRVLGWSAQTPMDEALRRTVAWYLAYLADHPGPGAA